MAAEILDTVYSVVALGAAFGIILLGFSLLVRADLFREPPSSVVAPAASPPASTARGWLASAGHVLFELIKQIAEFTKRVIPGAIFAAVGVWLFRSVIYYGIYEPIWPPTSSNVHAQILSTIPDNIRHVLAKATAKGSQGLDDSERAELQQWLDDMGSAAR